MYIDYDNIFIVIFFRVNLSKDFCVRSKVILTDCLSFKTCPNGKCLATKHHQNIVWLPNMLMLNRVAKRRPTCLIKRRSNPIMKRYLSQIACA